MTFSDLKLLNFYLRDLKEELMSALTDKIAETNASFDAALARVQEDVDALNAEVAELKEKVASGVATPEDLAALDALRARIDALDPTNPATLPDETTPDTEAEPFEPGV